jgi:hypothetical protein
VTRSAFFVDATCVASCDAQLHIWDCERATSQGVYGVESPYVCADVLRDRRACVAVVTSDGALSVIDARQARAALQWTLPSAVGTVRALACAPDCLAVAGTNGVVAALEARTGMLRSLLRVSEHSIYRLDASASGELRALTDGTVFTCDMERRVVAPLRPFADTQSTCCVALHSDVVLVGSASGRVVMCKRYGDDRWLFGAPTSGRERPRRATALAGLPLHRLAITAFDDGCVQFLH